MCGTTAQAAREGVFIVGLSAPFPPLRPNPSRGNESTHGRIWREKRGPLATTTLLQEYSVVYTAWMSRTRSSLAVDGG